MKTLIKNRKTTVKINPEVTEKLSAIRSRIQNKRRYAESQWLILEYCQAWGVSMLRARA